MVWWLRLIWNFLGLLVMIIIVLVFSVFGLVLVVIVVGRDLVVMGVMVLDELVWGNVFCFWVVDYWWGGYVYRIVRVEEEICLIVRWEDIW